LANAFTRHMHDLTTPYMTVPDDRIISRMATP